MNSYPWYDAARQLAFNPTVKLAFDPAKSEDPETKAIFADRISTTLWCLVRRDHIVSQHFNGDAIKLAKSIRKEMPPNADRLNRLLLWARDPAMQHPWSNDPQRVARLQELLDYLKGVRLLHLVIDEEHRKQ